MSAPMEVNGRPVPAQGTVLQGCRVAGVEVAAFCAADGLSVGGHCRSCMVEVDGRMVAACTTRARPGSRVLTESRALDAYRRDLGELMRAESEPGGEVAAWLRKWGVTGQRYPAEPLRHVVDDSHPYLRLDLDACILCRRCVRACEEVQGRFVYGVAGRGGGSRLSWGTERFADSDCVSCGACVDVCPTGAITDIDRQGGLPATATVRTTCAYCGVGCQLAVHTAGDQVIAIDGVKSSPVNHGHLCVKGRYAHGFLHHPDRLRTPLIRRGGQLVPCSWEEAMAAVVDGFARLDGRVAGLSSSRCTNEENYLLQKWMRGGWGTNDVDCCARVCHAPTAAGMRESFGTGAATNALGDIERADLVLVVGSNATEAHPVTGARLKQAVLRGAKLLVIDPRRTELAAMADVHLQVRPGGNVPLLNAMAAVMVEEGLVHRDFIAQRVSGWQEGEGSFVDWIEQFRPERVQVWTGVEPALVREAARAYATAARPYMCHGLGVTEHLQGAEAVRLLCNLALLTGAIGREGVGVNPLRGQNNVQGAADMGCQPDLLTGYQAVSDADVRERFGAVWGRPVPEGVGRTLPEMYEAALKGELRGLFILGEDVVQTDPDASEVRRALQSLDLLVVQELFLSETAKLAHVVLPGASFLEKEGTFTNGERRIQRVRAAVAPVGRPDWQVLCDLMAASGWPQPFRSPGDVWEEIRRVSPRACGGVTYERLDGPDVDGLQWPVPDLAHPGTARLHHESFPIGRGRLARVPFVPSPAFDAPLVLVTGRALEHYNCGTMTRRTPNLGLRDADLLEIHPDDALAHGIGTGDRVRLRSEQGEAVGRALITDRVRRGTLFLTFHFPETGTNELTSDVKDRSTGCPEYKLTAIELIHE